MKRLIGLLLIVLVGWQSISNTNAQFLINSYSFAQTDVDAEAFMASGAANITDATQRAAVTKLVIDLKAAGLWSKMLAIYPFVGGSANSHKFNLKDPRDADAAYRLSFVGTWTHSSTGVTPNGSSYANTFLNPTTAAMSVSNKHISSYCRSTGATQCLIGAFTSSQGDGLFPNFSNASDNYSTISRTPTLNSGGASQGFHVANRVSTSEFQYTRNDSNLMTDTRAIGTNPNHSYYIGARNDGGAAIQGSASQQAFVTIGHGLTSTERTSLYTAVSQFNSLLSR